MSWTDERIEKLTKMWEGGATASQIADELGGVSRNAVIGKAHRLGLKARPSPVKPNEVPEAPVRAAGSPSFDRLRHSTTLGFHSESRCSCWMPGKGIP